MLVKFKKSNTIKLTVKLIISFLLLILIMNLLPISEIDKCIWQRRIYEMELSGVITNKYYDQKNHNMPTFEYRQNKESNIKKCLLKAGASGIFEALIIGDTIFKDKYTDTFVVYNIDTSTIIVNYGCEEKFLTYVKYFY